MSADTKLYEKATFGFEIGVGEPERFDPGLHIGKQKTHPNEAAKANHYTAYCGAKLIADNIDPGKYTLCGDCNNLFLSE